MTLYEEHTGGPNDEYATKPELWRPLSRKLNGFDVDPAGGAESEQIAETVFTPTDDGLSQPWHGTVWLNPPFSEKLDWFRKAVNEVNCGNAETVVAIAPVDTSTQWFQRWFSKADVMCWLEGRDWYVDTGSPPFNTVIGVFGHCPGELIEILDSFGIVTESIEVHTQTKLTHE